MTRRFRVELGTELGQEMVAAVACPSCGAPAGTPCYESAVVHPERGDAFDEGVLAAIGEWARIGLRATLERDRMIVLAAAAGVPHRQIGRAAGLAHTAVAHIVRRDSE